METPQVDPAGEGQSVPTLSPIARATPPSPAPEPDTALPFGGSTSVPQTPIPLKNVQERWDSGEATPGLTPRPSAWDSFVAGAQKAVHDNSLGILYRLGRESGEPEGVKLSPEMANKMYPGRPVPYTTPVDGNIAALEYADRQKQQQLDEWVARGNHDVANWAGNFVGGLTDPMMFAIATMTGGVSEMVLPKAAPFLARATVHALGTWGGLVGNEAIENLLEHQMGARQKQLPEMIRDTAVPAAVMTGIGMGLGALARRFANERLGTAQDQANVRKTIAALENDQRPPPPPPGSPAAMIKAGAAKSVASAEPVLPTIVTSPIQETKLYGAAHSDGTPLIHEHGLGSGRQFTDSYDVANNGVSRSTDVPGQIGETKLPANSKLLDLDESASANREFLKAIEEKTGLPVSELAKTGESLKEVLTQVSDSAGVGKIPENIMDTIQEVAKGQGFQGYLFRGQSPDGYYTNRQIHMFDTQGMEVTDAYHANPDTTPVETPEQQTQMVGAQPAQEYNPAVEKAKEASYSPELEKIVHDFRKGKEYQPYSAEALTDLESQIEEHKQTLKDMAEESPAAQEALEEHKRQEVQDARLRDIAKRIAQCGAGGGV